MKKGKIVFKADIKAISPLLVGSGENEFSDIDVVLDPEGKPYIPATSFAGSLRSFFNNHVDISQELIQKIFGSEKSENDNYVQSSVMISDGELISDFKINIRDGIKINKETGITEDKAKYDYQIVERNSCFKLVLTLDISESKVNFNDGMKFLNTLVKILKQDFSCFRIGAKSRSGLGKIGIVDKSCYFELYDFNDKKNLYNWLIKHPSNQIVPDTANSFKLNINEAELVAYFNISTSIIVRSYRDDGNSDAVNIKSINENIIPGTSLKGAIRTRAEKIANTVFNNNRRAEQLVQEIFGFVNEDKKTSARGNVIVEEAILPEYVCEIQNRVKIDRFSGGAVKTSLFNSEPLFDSVIDERKKCFKISLKLTKYDNAYIGLLLLVLKDLWTEDLPIGGEKAIGRGILKGKNAVLIIDEKEYKFPDVFKEPDNLKQLNLYIQDFHNYGGKSVNK